MNLDPRRIARISTSVTFGDMTAMTWTADDPLCPSFEIRGPRIETGPFSAEALYLIPEPEPWRFAVDFQANYRARGLVFTAVPPGEAVTVSRSDLAREAGAEADGAVARACSAAGMPCEMTT